MVSINDIWKTVFSRRGDTLKVYVDSYHTLLITYLLKISFVFKSIQNQFVSKLMIMISEG